MSADGPSPYVYMPRRKRNHSCSDEDHTCTLFLPISATSAVKERNQMLLTLPIQSICRNGQGLQKGCHDSGCQHNPRLCCAAGINAISDASIKLCWRKAQRTERNRDPSLLRFTNMTPENYITVIDHFQCVHPIRGRRAVPETHLLPGNDNCKYFNISDLIFYYNIK